MQDIMEPTPEQMRAARLRARILAPAVTVAIAPLLLALTISALMGKSEFIDWDFRMWLWIVLGFTPAIAIASTWHAKLLTSGKPLHERSLTGISAILGILLHLGGLGATLLITAVIAILDLARRVGMPPESILRNLLLVLLAVLMIFITLAPYFMVAGCIMGLVTAAMVHYTYDCRRMASWSPARTAAAAVFGVGAILFLYSRFAEIPSAPTPPDLLVRLLVR